MNLRISTGQLRFRVSKDELASLCSGAVLEQNTLLPSQRRLVISIRTGETGMPLHLDYENDDMTLIVGKAAASTLLASLPNRQGLETQQALEGKRTLSLQLEVDIRSQKRDRNNKEKD